MEKPLGTIGELGDFKVTEPKSSVSENPKEENQKLVGTAVETPVQAQELVIIENVLELSESEQIERRLAEVTPPNEEIISISNAVGKLLEELDTTGNKTKGLLYHQRLLNGYMLNADVVELKEKKITQFLNFMRSLEIAWNYERNENGELVLDANNQPIPTTKRITRIGQNTVYIFKVPPQYRAYSPWVRASVMTDKQRCHVEGHCRLDSTEKAWYAQGLPRLQTRVCTFVLHDRYEVKWCAGEDPLYSPLTEKDVYTITDVKGRTVIVPDAWVKCGYDPYKQHNHSFKVGGIKK